ncbi:hypothetical protein [Caulobacter sp.]|uniref:EF-hand domain-containing protein n=1 Tax=Caulobacter sp. TaxID=78 RepID=UPI002B4770F1|nr:hypothetical protein [Caulobacter sp.]HJV40589.1 hypothetical protein [Caulobacter sp.]
MTSIASGGLTQQLYQRLFDHLDVDKSDGLSLDELKTAGPDSQDYASTFKTLDADTDGKISRAEMTGSSVTLSNDTLSALVEAQAASRSPTALKASKGTLPLLEGARSEQETQDITALFARADVDGDGKLSDSEWEAEKVLRRASNLDAGAISGSVFIAVDADGDGLTGTDEVRAGRLIPLSLVASTTGGPVPVAVAAERIKTPEQSQTDQAQRASNGDGPHKIPDSQIAAYRSAAQTDFSGMAMSETLSARLISQILAGLESQSDGLTSQTTA